MRTIPKDKYDFKDLEVLNAEQWQVDLLSCNPEYPFWGNYEDYMVEAKGWAKPLEFDSFSEMFELDELNECVNFYFELYRKNHECPHCEGENLNAATKKLADEWYDFEHTGNKWCNKLTEVEIEALVKEGRLSDLVFERVYFDEETQQWYKIGDKDKQPQPAPKMPSPDEVNSWAQRGLGHDAINRWICIKARAKHLGIYGHCEHCEGGYIYDEPKAKVALQLWILHPRKGAARGVYIKNIEQKEVPEVMEFLKEAAKRNADRFGNLK